MNICIHVYLQIWQREEYTIIQYNQENSYFFSVQEKIIKSNINYKMKQ